MISKWFEYSSWCYQDVSGLEEVILVAMNIEGGSQFIYACLIFHKSKIEHHKSSGLMQPLSILEWKWDRISMDFVTSFPKTAKGCDSIWVIIDRLTKSAHFIPIKINYPLQNLAELYIEKIVSLYGIPSSIMSDKDLRFTSRFWQSLQEAMSTKLKLSFARHPRTNGQTERTIQTLEDLLRVCVLEQGGNWDNYLSLVEFSYKKQFPFYYWNDTVRCIVW